MKHILPAVPVPRAAVVAAATCGSVAIVAAAFAAVYAWHRLWGPMPLGVWAANSSKRPRGGDAAGSGNVSASLKALENGKLQVTRGRLYRTMRSMCTHTCICDAKYASDGQVWHLCACTSTILLFE